MSPLLLHIVEGAAVGFAVTTVFFLFYARLQRKAARGVLAAARKEAEGMISEAAQKGETARAAITLEARMETLKLREELDSEVHRRRDELERIERRSEERSRALERKLEEIDSRERGFTAKEVALRDHESGLRARESEVEKALREQQQRLERIAGLTAEEARKEVMQAVEDEARSDAAALVRTSRSRPSGTPNGRPSASSRWRCSGSRPSIPPRPPSPPLPSLTTR